MKGKLKQKADGKVTSWTQALSRKRLRYGQTSATSIVEWLQPLTEVRDVLRHFINEATCFRGETTIPVLMMFLLPHDVFDWHC